MEKISGVQGHIPVVVVQMCKIDHKAPGLGDLLLFTETPNLDINEFHIILFLLAYSND